MLNSNSILDDNSILQLIFLHVITVAEQQKRSGHYGDKYEQRDAKSNKVSLFC